MWTKNGSRTLSLVLKRIEEVIPEEFVHNRILVDDYSTDDTVEIAKSMGWQVIFNEGKGISDGANTVLKYVETDSFVSFEQDLLLARDWWSKVPKHLAQPKVAVASGVRFPGDPIALRKLHEYIIERCEMKESDDTAAGFLYCRTLDNTIYKTAIMRRLGGFPRLSLHAGVDNVLAQRIYLAEYEWKVDYGVKSVHLRSGLKSELAHKYWHGTCVDESKQIVFNKPVDLKRRMLNLLFGPLLGLYIAIKKNASQIVYIYPLVDLAVVKGIIDGRRKRDALRC